MTTLFGAGRRDDRARTRVLAVPLSIAAHAVAVAVAVAVPLFLLDELPRVLAATPPPVWTPPAPPREPVRVRPVGHSKRAAGRASAVVRAAPTRSTTSVPTHVPDTLPTIESPGSDGGPLVIGPGGEACCGPTDFGAVGPGGGPEDGNGTADADGPLPIGGQVREPLKLHHVSPAYPALAQRAGLRGSVLLECVIDRYGVVKDVQVLGGDSLFTSAAVDAVRQWRYRPTLLNGVPVAVRLTVSVKFTPVR